MPLRVARNLCVVAMAMFTFAGCGDGRVRVPVSGAVTLDGEPLTDAYVYFNAMSGENAVSSMAQTDAEGRFALTDFETGHTGVPPGTYKVGITTVVPDPDRKEYDPEPVDRVPAAYRNKPLVFEVVEAGTTEANFHLKSK